MPKKVFIIDNVCSIRKIDASRIVRYFRANGCKIVKNPKHADFIIFVTCAFKTNKEEECFRLIPKFSALKGELIILGCLPAMAPTRFKQSFKGRFLVTKDLDGIGKLFDDFKINFSDIPDTHSIDKSLNGIHILLTKFFAQLDFPQPLFYACIRYLNNKLFSLKNNIFGRKPQMYILRISEGCSNSCSFCAIRNATGNLKSKAVDVCKNEYRDLLESGARNFTFLATDTGAYGADIGSSFLELLNSLSIADKDLNVKWYIANFAPQFLIRHKSALSNYIKEKKLSGIHVEVQSGSNRLLKLMNRFNDIEEISRVMIELKRMNADFALDTQIIVGFPSENEEDIRATLNLIDEVRFNTVELFAYSDKEGTIAHGMSEKIDAATIKNRLNIIIRHLKKRKIAWQCDDA